MSQFHPIHNILLGMGGWPRNKTEGGAQDALLSGQIGTSRKWFGDGLI
jgi:hypothetical protein